MEFHKLKVASKIQETQDAYSFLLELPEDLESNFQYKPGQYLTVKCEIAGQEYRRAYSIFTAPYESNFGFTVKRLPGGKVSNYLIDKVQSSDELEIMVPEGRFKVTCNPVAHRDHYFFAGGSGITPIMAMISEILENESQSACYLLYANRDEDSIIFKEQLDAKKTTHENQFMYDLILSQPLKSKQGGIKGLFGKSKPSWKGLKGRINRDIMQRFMADHPSRSGDDVYYVCGPAGMMQVVERYFQGKGIDQVKKEHFANPDQKEGDGNGMTSGLGACKAQVSLNGETFTLEIPADKTVLDAIIDMGKDPPYSCTSGACSTCMAKVTEGKVEMDSCFALDDEEVDDGYVLTCQSRCKSATLAIDYDA